MVCLRRNINHLLVHLHLGSRKSPMDEKNMWFSLPFYHTISAEFTILLRQVALQMPAGKCFIHISKKTEGLIENRIPPHRDPTWHMSNKTKGLIEHRAPQNFMVDWYTFMLNMLFDCRIFGVHHHIWTLWTNAKQLFSGTAAGFKSTHPKLMWT